MMANELQQSQDRTMEVRGKEAVQQEGMRPGWVFRPDVDIVEKPEEYVVTADLPGVGEEDLQVHLEKGVLTIEAQPSIRSEDHWQPLHLEYRIGGYRRDFAMSEAVDAQGISARMRDGVLEIRLPKPKPHQPRRIAVTRG